MPVIDPKKETPKEAVCLVFERVNTGGVALNVFELLTASFAADDFQLRDDWNAREQRLKGQRPVLRDLQNDDFAQAISLLVTRARRRRQALAAGAPADDAPGIGCKREDILELEVGDGKAWAAPPPLDTSTRRLLAWTHGPGQKPPGPGGDRDDVGDPDLRRAAHGRRADRVPGRPGRPLAVAAVRVDRDPVPTAPRG